MRISKLMLLLLLFTATATQAQKNFSYTPEKPKPGDVITFTYEPAGDIANTIKPVEAAVFQMGKKINKAEDLPLERLAGKFSGKFTADTVAGFIYFGFSSDKKFDNNFNEGYYIQLYSDDKPREGSYFSISNFYQFQGGQAGLQPDNEKALAAMEKEISLYPDNKKTYLFSYVRLQTLVKKDEAAKIIQKEIESLVKAGLKSEDDYSLPNFPNSKN